MNIEMKSVADKGNHTKERLVLKVLADSDVGDYLLAQTGYDEGGVTTGVHRAYWFPYKRVSAGDLVVLYTKSGKDGEREMKQGGKAHFFYWGVGTSIWNASDRAPVLLHAPEWVSKSPNEL